MQQAIPSIGQPWPGQGGVNVGLMRGENGKPDYFLILPTDEAAFIKSIAWADNYGEVEGAKHEFDGLENTIALLKSEDTHPAAEWAAGLVIEGHNDLYLPSRRENALIVANCADLVDQSRWHWSSTQYSAGSAWIQAFSGGGQHILNKYDEYAARAVRRYYPLSNSAI